jgi:hypothetical protein
VAVPPGKYQLRYGAIYFSKTGKLGGLMGAGSMAPIDVPAGQNAAAEPASSGARAAATGG